MNYVNYIVFFVLIIGVGSLYKTWEIKELQKDKGRTNVHIKDFLLNRTNTQDVDIFTRPFLWIHVDNEINARNWESFGSRSNRDLNKPYVYYCIKTIIQKCDKTFNICLIDDTSYKRLLENWEIDLTSIDITLRNKIRHLANAKLLYEYGGVLVPSSFVCSKSLKNLYFKNVNKNGIFACEKLDDTSYVTDQRYLPDNTFMGCKRKHKQIKDYCLHLEQLISTDYTSESDFKDSTSKYLSNLVNDNKISLIDGKFIGIKDAQNKPISLEELFNTQYIDIIEDAYGIYIPDKKLALRTAYNWFLRIDIQSILDSELIISKYMVLAQDINR
jgi:hypothetical protein